jgi:hypothetical protein
MLDLELAHASALERWQTPCPTFTSGHDPRTTDEGLLGLTYGGLLQASRYEWLNAGRRLIDKTYIDMLWHVQGLIRWRTPRPEQIAADLDNVIRARIAPAWRDLPGMNVDRKRALAGEWVEAAARECFGSQASEVAASRLLFFLCPILPVFNLSRGHLEALRRLGHEVAGTSYREYAAAAWSAYANAAPRLATLDRPEPTFGNERQQAVVREVMAGTDWWQRRVFDKALRQLVAGTPRDDEGFGCGEDGSI